MSFAFSPSASEVRMQGRPKDSFTLLLTSRDGSVSKELPVVAGKISRSADTLTDGWTATVPWIPGQDSGIDKLLAPYAYPHAQIYLGPRLVNTGYLYSASNKIEMSGTTKDLEGAASTADLVDSTVQPDAQGGGCFWYNISIIDFGKVATKRLGTDCVSVLSGAYLEPFPVVQCSVTDKWGDVVTRLAFQRQCLATNDFYGNLLVWAANTGSAVGTLRESESNVTSWNIKFDGRQRFGTYVVYGQDAYGSVIQSEATDSMVPSWRVQGVTAGQLDEGNVKVSAPFAKNQQLVKALTLKIPVSGWYAPDGSLWSPNTRVTVVSPSLHIPKGFTFLIRQSEHNFTATEQTTTLSLVPPQVYSNSPLQEPWAT